jgi:chemotaxis protein CheC
MEVSHSILSAEDTDVLQELMNIAFGKAAADLSQVMDLFVVLSVPKVRVISAAEFLPYLRDAYVQRSAVNVVEQAFRGPICGRAVLTLPANSSQKLLAALGAPAPAEPGGDELDPAYDTNVLERETLMEVGNIVIGACVGKLAELLDCVVMYAPPAVTTLQAGGAGLELLTLDPSHSVIVLQTLFCFNDQDASGHVFLIIDDGSASWLRQALARFLASYGQG